jgi:hypothetical protein
MWSVKSVKREDKRKKEQIEEEAEENGGHCMPSSSGIINLIESLVFSLVL